MDGWWWGVGGVWWICGIGRAGRESMGAGAQVLQGPRRQCGERKGRQLHARELVAEIVA